MICENQQELESYVAHARHWTQKGKVADYIPALAKANQAALAVSIYEPGKHCFSAGEVEHKFTLQSISKVLALAVALEDIGEEAVFEHIGMEPTGDPFNSIIKLETYKPSKPLNPMINAGALAVTSLIRGSNNHERLERLLHFIQDITNNSNVKVCEEVAQSEFDTSFLNRSMCYYMKQHNVISGDVEEILELYTKQCAVEVSCRDLARIGAVFAFDGKDPDTDRRIFPTNVARICKTFMVTCGMYNASGEFAIKVGIPAKSGVSGGIMCAVPGRIGIGIFSPALDEKGNSLAGMRLLEKMAKAYDLSMF
ncbi:glutaminase A [Bacillus solimangrovi]|uniref:Glutaminase n=1 Tax=Bacillus solimangrovi TaxID=1305675 RepID=A0A1E5LIM7_9BACI|nr:glutaminase A [Bacillus solimangrovi]OEH93908.1 glutaminase A [Bacillus solimangrovi]